MASLTLTIHPQIQGNKVKVELDADQLERLAASLGFFNPEFIESLERSEEDYKAGRFKKIKSLSDLD